MVPGGPLAGPAAERRAAEACSDDVLLAAVETRGEWLRHSVTVFCFADAGVLYIPARNGATKRWTRNALRESRVRVEIDGGIHEGRLVRTMQVPDAAARAFLRKAVGVEVQNARFLLEPPAAGEDRADLWVFRFEEAAS